MKLFAGRSRPESVKLVVAEFAAALPSKAVALPPVCGEVKVEPTGPATQFRPPSPPSPVAMLGSSLPM